MTIILDRDKPKGKTGAKPHHILLIRSENEEQALSGLGNMAEIRN